MDRRLAIASLILAVLLSWPLLMFGRPAYYEDTLSYYKGGRAAIVFAADKLGAAPSSAPEPAATAAAVETEVADAKGARSISYSILTFALAGPSGSLLPLALFQALLVAFCASVLLRANGCGRRELMVAAIILAAATPAAWFACFASPDVFAGVTILTIATVALFADRLSRAVLAALVLIGAFAITAHSSNLALALAMLPVVLLIVRTRLRDRRTLVFAAAPLVLGVAIVALGGLIGFGELSVAPKRYPLTLARSIGDGAARPYLRAECARERYLVCRLYPNGFPASSGDLLWGKQGIAERATPAEMEQLRAEEWTIVVRAALRHPLLELRSATRDTLRQLLAFRLQGVAFDQRMIAADDPVRLAPDRRTPPWLPRILDGVVAVAAAGSVIWCGWAYRTMPLRQRRLAMLLLAGLVLNAAICAFFSAVADRYQARAIWLLPLAALCVRPRTSAEGEAG